MEPRGLQELQSSAAEGSLLALGVASVAVTAAFFSFFALLWTPKLRGAIEALLDSAVRNFAALQGICVLAYVPYWSKDSYDYLRASEKWIWLDYFDSKISDKIDNPSSEVPPSDLAAFSDHWSNFYFSNIFTCTCFLTLSLLLSVLLPLITKYSSKAKNCFPLHGFDIFVRVLQLVHLRLSLSLLLEIRLLREGKDFDWSFGLAVGISALALFALPITQLIYLRLKERGNLEKDKVKDLIGATYREFRPCWQVFHFHMVFVENLALAVAICILGQWSNVQPYVIFFILLMSFLYTAIARPFPHLIHNLEESLTRFLRLLIGVLMIIAYKDDSIDFDSDAQSLTVFLLILLWLLCKIMCEVLVAMSCVKAARKILTAQVQEMKKLGSERTLGSILKTNGTEDSPGSKRRSKKANISPDVTTNEEGSARTDFLEAIPSAKDSKEEKEEIDPRLDRKTAGRRRRKKKVSIPA